MFFRSIKVTAAALAAPSIDFLDESVVTFRVWPNDLDLNIHMNNGRVVSIMDLGKFDLAMRSGMVKIAMKTKWRPMLGATVIRYRRSLAPFQHCTLKTKIVCWDDKWFYVRQKIETNEGIAALALQRGLWSGPKGSIPTDEVVRFAGRDYPSPAVPDYIKDWKTMELDMVRMEKENNYEHA